jgi:hypothetical protein
MRDDCIQERFYQRVPLGSSFPEKEQNDEGVPPAPRSNGNWGPGDRERRQRSVTASLITVNGEHDWGNRAADLERGATSGETVWSIK